MMTAVGDYGVSGGADGPARWRRSGQARTERSPAGRMNEEAGLPPRPIGDRLNRLPTRLIRPKAEGHADAGQEVAGNGECVAGRITRYRP